METEEGLPQAPRTGTPEWFAQLLRKQKEIIHQQAKKIQELEHFMAKMTTGEANPAPTDEKKASRSETHRPRPHLPDTTCFGGGLNARIRAGNRLHTIKQGERQSFAELLPLLEKEFADAGAIAWPDEAKRPIILMALNSTMKSVLLSRGVPATFQGIIDRLHEINTDLDLFNSLSDSFRTVGNQVTRTPAEVMVDTKSMDCTQTRPPGRI